jgi:hypothetical protein
MSELWYLGVFWYLFSLTIPSLVLGSIVRCLVAGVTAVRQLIETAKPPRLLRNAAWSFEVARFRLCPEVSSFDTVANTNNLHLPVMTHRAVDPSGRNIMATQAVLQDLRGRTMNVFFGKLLPLVHSRATLQAVSVVLTDGDKQEISGIKYAKSVGVFHDECAWRPCQYHNITQGLENPEHFGKARVEPKVYDNILCTLNSIATYYETKAEALDALARLRTYAAEKLSSGRADQLSAYLDDLQVRLDEWAFYTVIFFFFFFPRGRRFSKRASPKPLS